MNYYINKDTGDDARDGKSPETAWRSLKDSASRLVPGNTLHVAKASTPYTDHFITAQHGEENRPISIVTSDRAVIGGYGWILDADWWNVGGFHCEAFTGRMLTIGRDRTAHHVNVANLNFFHSIKPGVELWRVEDIAVIGCHFRNIRSRELGKDRNALLFKRAANRVLIARCQFEDIGSDGIHILPNGYFGFCGNIRIEDCQAWTNHPYGVKDWQDIYNGVGEGWYDGKYHDGPVYIRRCWLAGFHRIEEERDCSSGYGSGGTGIQIHCDARNVHVWDVHIEDGRRGVRVNPNVEPSVGPVWIGGLTTQDVEEPLSIRSGWDHVVHEIDEDPLPENGGGPPALSKVATWKDLERKPVLLIVNGVELEIPREDIVALNTAEKIETSLHNRAALVNIELPAFFAHINRDGSIAIATGQAPGSWPEDD